MKLSARQPSPLDVSFGGFQPRPESLGIATSTATRVAKWPLQEDWVFLDHPGPRKSAGLDVCSLAFQDICIVSIDMFGI